jgi:hypothetical protein
MIRDVNRFKTGSYLVEFVLQECSTFNLVGFSFISFPYSVCHGLREADITDYVLTMFMKPLQTRDKECNMQ